MNKQIARALVLKNFTEAKGLIFGSLYAKSSLAMDEARYEITKSMFNTPEESEEIIEEETEQLDELSPELLGRYIKKANRRAQSAAETIHAEVSKPLYQQNNTTKDVAADELIRRTRGIHRATARIVPKTIGEETEQLDELNLLEFDPNRGAPGRAVPLKQKEKGDLAMKNFANADDFKEVSSNPIVSKKQARERLLSPHNKDRLHAFRAGKEHMRWQGSLNDRSTSQERAETDSAHKAGKPIDLSRILGRGKKNMVKGTPAYKLQQNKANQR